ncbi:MAG: DUF3488 domain-containing transglutaminase family protein [Pseudomonadales bacterium]|nr:DUF3488 domain-containing transglutaminase family protein [Pseudomonadales bacterium]
MFDSYPMGRSAFFWLLVSQLFLLAPHLIRFPKLLILPCAISFVWAIQVYRARWAYPPMQIKVVLVVCAIAALVMQNFVWFSVEFMVCLLLLAYILKLLELRQHRDVLVMAYLSYFVIVGQCLFSQSLLSAVYLLLGLLLCTVFLIAAFSGDTAFESDKKALLRPLKTASAMVFISVPMMLLAFLIFPRLEPFWAVPMPGGQATTGVSDTMSPGMFSDLAQSDALAFRVSFVEQVPALNTLYWRGLVLTHFDGRVWKAQNESVSAQWIKTDTTLSKHPKVQYQITMEPSFKPWLFTLASVVLIEQRSSKGLMYQRDAIVRAIKPIQQRSLYTLYSDVQSVRDVEIYRYHRAAALALPEGFNPQTLVFANKLYAESTSDKAYIDSLLAYFNKEEFYYSLKPPALGRHYIDDFLFISKTGFCEHYASSFVVLLRAVGIPARVVAGYQGGDVNPYEKHVSVRQMDAHAWAEVWLEGRGWLRVDPTAAVAPERIDRGSMESFKKDKFFLANSPLSFRHLNALAWLSTMAYRYDQLNALWHQKVLAYEGSVQQNFLKALLGEVNSRNIALFMASGFAFFALLTGAYFALSWRPLKRSALDKTYHVFISKVRRAGLEIIPAEGPVDFQRRCVQRWPMSAMQIERICQNYIVLQYACETAEYKKTAELKALVKAIKRLSLVK